MVASAPKTERPSRLSAEDWAPAALDVIAEQGLAAVAVEPLARRLGVSRQAVHKLALEAERLGLVEFVPSEEDGRVKLLRFSQKGWRMSEEAAAAFVRMEEELARHIGKDNVEELRRILALPWPEMGAPEGD